MFTENQIRNFWEKVEISENDQCWNWKGAIHYKGYGEFRVIPSKQKAHRVAWILTFGKIPEGLLICHKCDNRKCCNPYHLFLGTNQDNIDDMVSKGRCWKPKGELNPSAKLKEGQVVQIRNLYEEGISAPKIAKMFGVSKNLIYAIISRKVWK